MAHSQNPCYQTCANSRRTVRFRISHDATLDEVPKNLWVDENLFSPTGADMQLSFVLMRIRALEQFQKSKISNIFISKSSLLW